MAASDLPLEPADAGIEKSSCSVFVSGEREDGVFGTGACSGAFAGALGQR